MTVQMYKVSGRVITNLIPPVTTTKEQPKRFYSLFQKKGRIWKRIRTAVYSMPTAYKVWEDELMFAPDDYSVRRVELDSLRAN
jgi:hypothetical protein